MTGTEPMLTSYIMLRGKAISTLFEKFQNGECSLVTAYRHHIRLEGQYNCLFYSGILIYVF